MSLVGYTISVLLGIWLGLFLFGAAITSSQLGWRHDFLLPVPEKLGGVVLGERCGDVRSNAVPLLPFQCGLHKRFHSGFMIRASRHPSSLEEDGHSHSARDAERGDSGPGVSALHLVEQRRDDAGAGRADGMTEGDRAAVDVDP